MGGAAEVGERTGATKTLERFVFQFHLENFVHRTKEGAIATTNTKIDDQSMDIDPIQK